MVHVRNAKSDFFSAAEVGNAATEKYLLGQGVEVDETSQDSSTALMLATKNGHSATVAALLEEGADINIRKKNGTTALMLAAKNVYAAILKSFLDNGSPSWFYWSYC